MNRRRVAAHALAAVGLLALPVSAGAATTQTTVPGMPGVAMGPAGSAFYDPPAKLGKGKHGSLIWARPIQAPRGANAWRVLYRSQLADGDAAAVSGFVVAPKGRAPKGGRPILAWAHGTEGTARGCAPSLVDKPAQELVDFFTYQSPYQQDVGVPALRSMVKAGYVVAATDYQGLGTPGDPQYAVLSSQSRNVLDSALAAQGLTATGAGEDVVVLGWSQGGGAALWSGQEPGYTPSLNVLGIAALAPESDTGPQAAGQVAPGPQTQTSPAHAAAIRINLYRGFANTYPELDPTDVLTPAGMQAYAGAGIQCINHFAYVIENNVTDLEGLFASPTTPPDWQRRMDENTAGLVAAKAPLLVMQGTADTVINPNGTTQYIGRACGFGTPIEYSVYEGATHQTIPYRASGEYLGWIADRFAGKPAPTNCAPAPSG